jgi:hypothetical protein
MFGVPLYSTIKYIHTVSQGRLLKVTLFGIGSLTQPLVFLSIIKDLELWNYVHLWLYTGVSKLMSREVCPMVAIHVYPFVTMYRCVHLCLRLY